MSESGVTVEKYRPLVVKHALSIWNTLPHQTKHWIGLDDMVEDAMYYAHSYVLPRWNAQKGASYATFLSNQLYRFFDNKYLSPLVTAAMRNEKTTVSIDADEAVRQQAEMVLHNASENYSLVDEHIVISFLKIYNAASTNLKGAMIRWFLLPLRQYLGGEGFHDMAFQEAAWEFRLLASIHELDINDCRRLYSSPEVTSAISKLVFIPC